jgi:hypothetical protein
VPHSIFAFSSCVNGFVFLSLRSSGCANNFIWWPFSFFFFLIQYVALQQVLKKNASPQSGRVTQTLLHRCYHATHGHGYLRSFQHATINNGSHYAETTQREPLHQRHLNEMCHPIRDAVNHISDIYALKWQCSQKCKVKNIDVETITSRGN